MALDFVAMDFETAAGPWDTACSVSLVRVRNGLIVDHYSTLINPECEFSPFNIRINHITPEMVEDAPTFPEIVPALCDFIGEDVLVAHNASFDMGVLNSMFERYQVPMPHFDSLCTVQAARRAYPDFPDHKLKTLCNKLDISLENHHDAACDACACANVLNAIADKVEATSFDELSDRLHMNIDFVIRHRQKLARLKTQQEKEAKAAAKAEREAERAAMLAEKEARRLEREAKRAQREAEKAAAAERITPARPVMQLTEDGVLIKVFPSVAEASRAIGIDKKGIRDTANGKQRRAAGFRWAWCETSVENGDINNGK